MAVFSAVWQGRIGDSQLSVSIAGSSNPTLATDHLVARHIELTGAITANLTVYLPLVASDEGLFWVFHNNTSGAYTVTIQSTSGTGKAVVQGKRAMLYWDGTNICCLADDAACAGAANSGANTNITGMTGITAGITMYGGLNLGDGIGGNSAQSKPFALIVAAVTLDSDASTTLDAAEYACPIINLTGTPGAAYDVIFPLTAGGVWLVYNNATTYDATIKGSSGSGVVIKNGRVMFVRCDGTNFLPLANHTSELSIGAAGTPITQIRVLTATFNPASVGASTTVEQTVTVTGITTSDKVIAFKPTVSTGLAVGQCRATNTDEVTVTLINASTGAVDAGSETWTFLAIRS